MAVARLARMTVQAVFARCGSITAHARWQDVRATMPHWISEQHCHTESLRMVLTAHVACRRCNGPCTCPAEHGVLPRRCMSGGRAAVQGRPPGRPHRCGASDSAAAGAAAGAGGRAGGARVRGAAAGGRRTGGRRHAPGGPGRCGHAGADAPGGGPGAHLRGGHLAAAGGSFPPAGHANSLALGRSQATCRKCGCDGAFEFEFPIDCIPFWGNAFTEALVNEAEALMAA